MEENFLDTETTGLEADQGDRIIQVAVVKAINGKIVNRLSQHINPEGKRIALDAYEVHGIQDNMLTDQPTFEEFYPTLKEFLGDGIVIAHNAPFDVGFLSEECARKNLQPLVGVNGNPVIDSIKTANTIFPGQPTGLDALCKRLKVDVGRKRDKHDALIDCELLFEVYQKLKKFEVKKEQQDDLFLQEQKILTKISDRKKIPVFLLK